MSEKGDLFIQAAEDDFAAKLSGEMTAIKVPEMGEDAVLYFKPSTLHERDLIVRAIQNGGLDSLVEIMIVRSRDEDGKRLFANKHKVLFERKIDPDVIIRIASELGEAEGVDMDSEDDGEKK